MDLWPSRGCVREGMYPNMVEQATANENKPKNFLLWLDVKRWLSLFSMIVIGRWVGGWVVSSPWNNHPLTPIAHQPIWSLVFISVAVDYNSLSNLKTFCLLWFDDLPLQGGLFSVSNLWRSGLDRIALMWQLQKINKQRAFELNHLPVNDHTSS